MRILIVTIGSRGDVQPYVALGKGLRAAGHAVTVCTNQHFETFVREHGLDYGPMNNGFVDLITSLQGRAGLERMTSLPGTLLTIARLARQVGPLQQRTLEDAWRCAQAIRPDVILLHPKLPGVVDMADALEVPAIVAPLFPQVVATGAFPPVGFPPLPLGAGYRRLAYRLVESLTNGIGGGPIRAWRRDAGLGPRPRRLGLQSDRHGEPLPVLHAFSEALCPRPHDWPASAIACGFWSLEAASAWTPPAALQAFLDAGPPPVYVGFGSMAGRDPQRLGGIVVAALRRAGLRGLIATGWGGLAQQDVPAEILVLDEAPHDWLFPRVAAVVHHGGAGTTAAGLRAGRPTVICPFFADQPFWGRQVHRRGAGPAPIAQKRLTVDGLAAAISAAVTDPAIRRSAEAIQDQLQREQAVPATVAWIERYVAAWRPGDTRRAGDPPRPS